MSLFDQMLDSYNIRSEEDEFNAIREIMQKVVLAGLFRSDFFKTAAFYGGTCLRIFHGLNRFSEDMDFSLLKYDNKFNLENYFDTIIEEFSLIGKDVQIIKKEKKTISNIESAFLKQNKEAYDVSFSSKRKVKIKIEVDTNPPLKFNTEQKLLITPYSFMVSCFTIPDLFAGKIHAFLFRNWKNRVKGRDWYDLEWYIKNKYKLGFKHFKERAIQSGDIKNQEFKNEDLKELLINRIKETPIKRVIEDVKPFIKDQQQLNIWSEDYFLQLIELMEIEE